MTKIYEDIKSLVEDELEVISKKQEMSEQDLMTLDKLIDVKKDLCEIESMEMTGGYSGHAPYTMMPYYGVIGYDEGSSYGRGGNRMGNYANYRGNYAQGGNSGRNYAGNGSSYGRYEQEDMRMNPDRREWM